MKKKTKTGNKRKKKTNAMLKKYGISRRLGGYRRSSFGSERVNDTFDNSNGIYLQYFNF